MTLALLSAGFGSAAGSPGPDSWASWQRPDFSLFVRCFTAAVAGADRGCRRVDLDHDGHVTLLDLAGVVQAWSRGHRSGRPANADVEAVAMTSDETILLHAPRRNRILRWSTRTGEWLPDLKVDAKSRRIVYSPADDSIYVAYADGRVTRITGAAPGEEVDVIQLESDPHFLAAVGRGLLAVRYEAYGDRILTFDREGGAVSSWLPFSSSAPGLYAYSEINERFYMLPESPDDSGVLNAVPIDPATVRIDLDYYYKTHRPEGRAPPLRVSPDGARVLTGNGFVYDGSSLLPLGRLESDASFEEALWLRGGGILTFTTEAGWRANRPRTAWHHHGADLRLYDASQVLPGRILAAFETEREILAVLSERGRIRIRPISLDPDVDGDGVLNEGDAFPRDPAASIDEDGDGAPEAWNAGHVPGSPETDLVLDVFPNDPECWSEAHRHVLRPDECDPARYLPSSYRIADYAISDDGMLHVLSTEYEKIFRYSLPGRYHETAIDVGPHRRHVAWSAEHGRLYTSGSRDVGTIEVNERGGLEDRPFAEVRHVITDLVPWLDFLLVLSERSPSAAFTDYGFPIPAGISTGQTGRIQADEASRRLYVEDYDDLTLFEFDPNSFIARFRKRVRLGPSHRRPARLARDGRLVALANGELRDGDTLEFVDRLPIDYVDALWLDDGTIVTVRSVEAGRFRVEQWDRDLALVDVRKAEGEPREIFEWQGEIFVLTDAASPVALRFRPDPDADGDGVPTRWDAFPLDPAASVDRDRDGAPDALHPGVSSPLTVDAFPLNSACRSPGDALPGQPGVCDVARALLPYAPTRVEVDDRGTLYLLSPEHDRVFRYSVPKRRHLDPIVTRAAPRRIAYSTDRDALFVGYTGVVERIDAGDPLARPEAAAAFPSFIQQLEVFGDRLMVDADARYVVEADGAAAGVSVFGFPSSFEQAAWNARTGSFYSTAAGSFYRIEYDVATSTFPDAQRAPCGRCIVMHGPVRVSPAGDAVLLASGEIFDAETLELVDSLGDELADGLWLEGGELLVLRAIEVPGSNRDFTVVQRWSADRQLVNETLLDGAPIRVLQTQGEIVVVTAGEKGPSFFVHRPNLDGDADGVSYSQDAFPLDPAASLDRDGDGFPDRWNRGFRARDSVFGLSRDAFPRDSACSARDHAIPGRRRQCDIEARVPSFRSTWVSAFVDGRGVAHLHQRGEDRLYRWSLENGQPLNPIPFDREIRDAAYSAALDRIYVVLDAQYASQSASTVYVDLSTDPFDQKLLDIHPGSGVEVLAAGRDVVVTEARGAGQEAYIYDELGVLRWRDKSSFGNPYWTWSPVERRLYTGGYELSWSRIDEESRALVDPGSSPRTSGVEYWYPLRFAPDASLALSARGQLIDAETFELVAGLSGAYEDARWIDSGFVTLRRWSTEESVLEQWGRDGTLYLSRAVPGEAVALLPWDGSIHAVGLVDGAPVYTSFEPVEDADGDGVANVSDAFPRDVAAALDRDGDGWPDAWNPGYEASDSTTGLALDAWPEDSACQLAEHGRGDECDFRRVLPAIGNRRFCTDDSSVESSGGVSQRPSRSSFEPLCDGWVILGEDQELVVRNLLDGRLGTALPLSGRAGRILLDETNATIVVTLDGMNRIAILDPATGSTREYETPDVPIDLALAGGGVLFSSSRWPNAGRLHWIDPMGVGVAGAWEIDGVEIATSPTNGDLVVASSLRSGPTLARYRFDPETGPALVERSSDYGLRVWDVEIAADGRRIVLSAGDGTGPPTALTEFDAEDLTASPETWELGFVIADIAFDGSGTRLLAGARDVMRLYEYPSRVLIREREVSPDCRGRTVDPVRFSRGGRVGLGGVDCSLRTQIQWMGVD